MYFISEGQLLKHKITSLSYIPYAPLALFWHRIKLCTSGILMRNNNKKIVNYSNSL